MQSRHLMQVNPAPCSRLAIFFNHRFIFLIQLKLLTIGVSQSRQNGDQWELQPLVRISIPTVPRLTQFIVSQSYFSVKKKRANLNQT